MANAERNHDDSRRRLLEAAGEVFAEKGFQAATVREICHQAGANVAAINYYFGDKRNLYLEAVQYAHLCHDPQPLPQWPDDTPPVEKLRRFVEFLVSGPAGLQGPSWARRLMIREMVEPSEACLAIVEGFVRPKAELLRDILVELLPPGIPAVDAHLIAFSIVGQCLFHRTHHDVARLVSGPEICGEFTTAKLAQHITRFSLAAIRQFASGILPNGGDGTSDKDVCRIAKKSVEIACGIPPAASRAIGHASRTT
jgi:AcrR family transcriptional regulator